MFVGDRLKSELEMIIRRFRPALQMRLRFITHLNIEEIGGDRQNELQGNNTPAAIPAQVQQALLRQIQ